MGVFLLKIYGINIKVSSSSDFAFENLKKDFQLYLCGKIENHLSRIININIFKEKPPYQKVPPLEASLYSLGAICYRDKDVHYIDYSGKCLMIYDFTRENADIYSEYENLLYEKARLTILSRTGELLDKRHIHRVHAVGLAKDGDATICLLPMAAGKTTLALDTLKKDSQIKLISDDICLMDSRNHVYPFMLRIGTRDRNSVNAIPEKYITRIYREIYGEKYLIDLAYFEGRIAGKSRVRNILIGKRIFQADTEIRKIPKIKCYLPFIQCGVFGLGLPQIVELFLRSGFRDILNKINIVFSRTIIFLVIISRANTYEIRIGRDLGMSADTLIDFINKPAE